MSANPTKAKSEAKRIGLSRSPDCPADAFLPIISKSPLMHQAEPKSTALTEETKLTKKAKTFGHAFLIISTVCSAFPSGSSDTPMWNRSLMTNAPHTARKIPIKMKTSERRLDAENRAFLNDAVLLFPEKKDMASPVKFELIKCCP